MSKRIIFKLLILIFINYAEFLNTTNNVTLSTRVLMLKFGFFNVMNWKCFAKLTLYSQINNESDFDDNSFQFNDFHEIHIIWRKNCFFSLKYNIHFNELDISNFENEIFFCQKWKAKSNFRNNNYFVADWILFWKFPMFSNDDFFHSKIIKIKNENMNNENSNFKLLIIINENTITTLHDFANATKMFQSEYETWFK